MKKVLVLGATGLLGSSVFTTLEKISNFKIVGTSSLFRENYLKFDANNDSLVDLIGQEEPSHIVNCIGLVPQKKLNVSNFQRNRQMFHLNSFLPRRISQIANERQIGLIQIRTDCVFSGRRGNYKENSLKLPNGVYGWSKLLGEKSAHYNQNIRCSIIGNSDFDNYSLFGWFKNLPEGAEIYGYTNHLWNGVTTDIFAKLVASLILETKFESFSTHLVPEGFLSKFELLHHFKLLTGRKDINIIPKETPKSIDRRLVSTNTTLNQHLWKRAGYKTVPHIKDLISFNM